MAGKKRRIIIKWIKRVLAVAFLGAVAAMVVMAWMPKPLPVETAQVVSGALVVTVSEDGRSRVIDRYIVSPRCRASSPASRSTRATTSRRAECSPASSPWPRR